MTTIKELAEKLRHKLYQNPTQDTVELVVAEIKRYNLSERQIDLLFDIIEDVKNESSNTSFEDCVIAVKTKIKNGK